MRDALKIFELLTSELAEMDFSFDDEFINDAFNSNDNISKPVKKPEKAGLNEGYISHRLAWFDDNKQEFPHTNQVDV